MRKNGCSEIMVTGAKARNAYQGGHAAIAILLCLYAVALRVSPKFWRFALIMCSSSCDFARYANKTAAIVSAGQNVERARGSPTCLGGQIF
jgi:hypothetical protein